MVLPGRDMPWREFFSAIYREWVNDGVGDVAGALTFFGVLALFPFLLFLVALGSLVIDPQTAEVLIGQLATVAPQAVTEILGERLRALGSGSAPGLLTVSAIAALWFASAGVVSLVTALNVVYDVRDSRSWLRVRALALVTTIVAAALALIAASVMVVLPPLAEAIDPMLGRVVLWLRLPVAGLTMMLVWALLYYFLPDVEQSFRFITPGSITGVVLWLAASVGFSEYVRHFGQYEVTYGALGGVAILLLWMWISAQIVLLGAVINSVLEHKDPEGKRLGARSLADAGPGPAKSEVVRDDPRVVSPPPDARPPPAPPRRRLRPVRALLPLGLGFAAGLLLRRSPSR